MICFYVAGKNSKKCEIPMIIRPELQRNVNEMMYLLIYNKKSCL